MRGYIARRILVLVPVALGVATLTFAMIHLTPGDPVVAMLGENAAPADVEGLRHTLGLDQPLLRQYFIFLSHLLRGDLGQSIVTGAPVANLVLERFPATLELAAAALSVAILVAFALGFLASVRPGSGLDLGAMGFAVLGVSVPHLCLGPLLMIAFSLRLGWLPLSGRGGLAHLVLPAVTLGTAMAAIVARILRQSLIEAQAQDYMRTARSKGLGQRAALVRHAVRNAATPVITVLGLEVGALLTGSIVIEQIFSWPGLGRLMLQAIGSRDYPLVEGCVLAFSLSYVLVNLLTDLLYAVVDPRVRLG
jgi:peptide/nickel transport system permease protein